ncbi:MAG: hypothetical protein C4319_05790 [Acidimicrobiia bacterium]
MIGVAIGLVVVLALVAAAVLSTRSARLSRGLEGNAPPGFRVHDSQLGYRAAIPATWTSQVDLSSRAEFLWSPGQEAGVIVADLGTADTSIYSLSSEELVAKGAFCSTDPTKCGLS